MTKEKKNENDIMKNKIVQSVISMLEQINDEEKLMRIYKLVQYIYVNK